MNGHMCILSNSAGETLVRDICERLSIEPTKRSVSRFRDGEVGVQILDNVRGSTVFVVGPTNPPLENGFEMILLAKTALMSSAKQVILVPTYLGYARQDRKDKPRVPVSAKVFIDMLKLSGAHRALLLDVHAEQIVPHFEPMVTDHLYGSYVGVPYLKGILNGQTVVASPDSGGVARASKYTEHLGLTDIVIFSKSRSAPGEIKEVRVTGDVSCKDVLFVDDIIDSGGTLIETAKAAKAAGAKRIFAFATHGIFSRGTAVFPQGLFEEIVVTDSVPHEAGFFENSPVSVHVCPLGPFLAQAIRRLYEEESLTQLILKN